MSIEGCSDRELGWLLRAANLAENGLGRSRHGALVVRGGRVLGSGINVSRTHHRWEIGRDRRLCSIHAEVRAMRSASSGVGATIYVARVTKCGMLRRSAPCSDCYEYLRNNGVKKVVHS